MIKKKFSHYTCCKLQDLCGQENLRKMDAKMVRKSNQNGTTNHPDAGFLRFWAVLGGGVFSTFFGTSFFVFFKCFFSKMVDLWIPLKIQWGQKWHQNPPSGATNLKFLALRSVCLEVLKPSCFQDCFKSVPGLNFG